MENRIRKKQFKLFLLEEEYEVLVAKADEAEMTKSEFIRNVILYGAAHRTTFVSKETQDKILTELSMIGNNVNQFARVANCTKGADRGEIENMVSLIMDVNDLYFTFFNR